jgi:hypothetical protein
MICIDAKRRCKGENQFLTWAFPVYQHTYLTEHKARKQKWRKDRSVGLEGVQKDKKPMKNNQAH